MDNCCRIVLLSLILLIVTPFSAGAESRVYNGICEASAAVLIDETHVAIASDDFEAILIFQRLKPEPIARFEVSDVTDIEAATRIGDTVFWLASHSLNSKLEDKKKRKVLFATKVAADGTLLSTGNIYRALRADMAVALGRTEGRMMPDLNIEGLTNTPEGNLLVGLRGPTTMPGDRAILLEIANPLAMVNLQPNEGGPVRITRVVTLDLSDGPGTAGRGVRDISRIGNRYLIVAGSEPDGGDPPPKLFWWGGTSENDVTLGPKADFSGMTPEAMVVWSDHEAEIFSDDGGAMIGDSECQDKAAPPGAFFRAVDVDF